jgi:hypothetical protein
LVRLDAKTSNPYQREDFKRADLLSWVAEHRGRMVASLLTIARAWVAANKPPARVRRIGSFEKWATTIGGILAHCGIAGFLGNSERLDEADEDAPQFERFLYGLRDMFGSSPFTSADVVERARTSDRLRDSYPDSLASQLERINSSPQRVLGKLFHRIEGARYGEDSLYVTRVGESRKGAIRWQVGWSKAT